MIKVGDIVRVTDWGGQYSTNIQWFIDHKDELDIGWIIRFAYDDNTLYENNKYDDNTKYRVLFVDTRYYTHDKVLITSTEWRDKVYLIDVRCLELYDTPTEMTISEIEEKLGIKNLKIVKENGVKED